MALLKLSTQISSLHGSIDGITFRRDRSGVVAFTKVTPVLRRSESQRVVRKAFGQSVTLATRTSLRLQHFDNITMLFPSSLHHRLTAIGYWWYFFRNGLIPDDSFLANQPAKHVAYP